MVKFDTAHENETGYSLVLASALRNPHHKTETGFCVGLPRILPVIDAGQERDE
jgi:hypothetical protein